MIRIRIVLFAAALLAGRSYASKVSCPGCTTVDRIFEHRDVSTERSLVISSLRSIALGQEIVESLRQGFLFRFSSAASVASLGEIEARAHALSLLAEIDEPEVTGFINSLSIGSLGKDPSNSLDSMIVLARVKVRVLHEADPAVQLKLLEAALEERSYPVGNGAVASWAEMTLCNQGSRLSVPLIEKSLRRRYGALAGEQIDYCTAKISLVESSADRLTALSNGLVVTSDALQAHVALWAVSELDRMHSEQADEALSIYAVAIQRLPAQAKERIALVPVTGLIESIRSRRSLP